MNVLSAFTYYAKLVLLLLFLNIQRTQAQSHVREFVLLVYLNGSNLETEHRFASQDLQDMIRASADATDDFASVLLLGGTKKWHLEEPIASDSITYASITAQGFEKLQTLENTSIGHPRTLADFLAYSKRNFPAKRYGLIFWNHGRGSVYGFGYDEWFPDDISLSLSEMKEAFQTNVSDSTKFDFIGFDACLMAGIETANTFAPFANYLIASQELEPGEGWNYKNMFSTLSRNPSIATGDLARLIIDDYIDYYADKTYIQATLSAIDLQYADSLNSSVERLSERLSAQWNGTSDRDQVQSFRRLSASRSKARTFGIPTYSYAAEDMVDLRSFFNITAGEVDTSIFNSFKLHLKQAVLYQKTSSNLLSEDICGLSIYFPFYNKKTARDLGLYYQSTAQPAYHKLLRQFVDELLAERKDSVFHRHAGRALGAEMISHTSRIYLTVLKESPQGGKISYGLDGFIVGLDNDGNILLDGDVDQSWDRTWIRINKIPVCVFMGDSDMLSTTYTVPVTYNSQRADLVIRYEQADTLMEGRVVGVRKINVNGVPDKIKMLEKGDAIMFLYPNFDESMPYMDGDSLVITTNKDTNELDLKVDLQQMESGKYQVGFCLIDYYGNRYFTAFDDYTIR